MSDDPVMAWMRLANVLAEGDQRFEYGQGRAFCSAFMRYYPWLEEEGTKLLGWDKERAHRAARRTLLRLWEWDVTRFRAANDAYLRRALLTAMRLEAMGEGEVTRCALSDPAAGSQSLRQVFRECPRNGARVTEHRSRRPVNGTW